MLPLNPRCGHRGRRSRKEEEEKEEQEESEEEAGEGGGRKLGTGEGGEKEDEEDKEEEEASGRRWFKQFLPFPTCFFFPFREGFITLLAWASFLDGLVRIHEGAVVVVARGSKGFQGNNMSLKAFPNKKQSASPGGCPLPDN